MAFTEVARDRCAMTYGMIRVESSHKSLRWNSADQRETNKHAKMWLSWQCRTIIGDSLEISPEDAEKRFGNSRTPRIWASLEEGQGHSLGLWSRCSPTQEKFRPPQELPWAYLSVWSACTLQQHVLQPQLRNSYLASGVTRAQELVATGKDVWTVRERPAKWCPMRLVAFGSRT